MTLNSLQPMIVAMEAAARLTTHVQKHFLQQHNKSSEPVTIGDYGAQAILCRAIAEHFPDDAVIAEESGAEFIRVVNAPQRRIVCDLVSDILETPVNEDDMQCWLNHGRDIESPRTWMIDPIDGTKGFIAQRRYAIAVGLCEGSHITAGLMGCPRFEVDDIETPMLFVAADGMAYERGLWDDGEFVRIKVADRTDGPTLFVAGSVDEKNNDVAALAHVYAALNANHQPIARSDGMGKYAMVARGDIDLYMRIPDDHYRRAKVWDHAAGVAILEAAGGLVTDKDGNALDFAEAPILESTTFVIVTNGHIHDAVIDALRTYPLQA